ncbi:hypothetical protein AMTR_s00005p00080120 [Amborella trichopoda]|uniref:Uncharacterized protein n=1 Tax=Amborella trichopoda TaxID=13333 RepID=W1PI17_AMBTC|nr:hypothetical protein AMTR_s00005p00080120 [Amborella trichopoda]
MATNKSSELLVRRAYCHVDQSMLGNHHAAKSYWLILGPQPQLPQLGLSGARPHFDIRDRRR